MIPTVLSIAGLDPSGGAGMAADLKTATMMGTYGMAALTTVTIQHPGAVEAISPLSPALVEAQIQTLLKHMPIGAIKIGLIGSTDIAEVLISTLAETSIPVVLDPVSESTSGETISVVNESTMAQLLRRADVVTPNSDELVSVVGELTPGAWAARNDTALLCTGGHGPAGPIINVLWLPNGTQEEWSHPRVQTQHTHGTGCTLSTAIAAGLALGKTVRNAVEHALSFTHQAVEHSADGGLVSNNGPLLHFRMNG
jgi:hydroxymethylpyrimidine/phosphomethylpyrimidine kinase